MEVKAPAFPFFTFSVGKAFSLCPTSCPTHDPNFPPSNYEDLSSFAICGNRIALASRGSFMKHSEPQESVQIFDFCDNEWCLVDSFFLTRKNERVAYLAFHPSGNFLAMYNDYEYYDVFHRDDKDEKDVTIRSLSGSIITVFKDVLYSRNMMFTLDGTHLVIESNVEEYFFKVYSVETGECTVQAKDVHDSNYSDDSDNDLSYVSGFAVITKNIVTTTLDGQLAVYNMDGTPQAFCNITKPICAICVDEYDVYVVCFDGHLGKRDLRTLHTTMWTTAPKKSVLGQYKLCLSPRRDRIAVAQLSRIFIYCTTSGALLQEINLRQDLYWMMFTPDNAKIVYGSTLMNGEILVLYPIQQRQLCSFYSSLDSLSSLDDEEVLRDFHKHLKRIIFY